MNTKKGEKHNKLWVIKFCLKLLFPKCNLYLLLAYMGIKFRLQIQRRNLNTMEHYKIKCISSDFQKYTANRHDDDCISIYKCLIISKRELTRLACENLFYIDKGVLWMTLSLSSETKKQLQSKTNTSHPDKKLLRYNLAEIHKKLWSDKVCCGLENWRIVSVLGADCVPDDVIQVEENELHNILTSFGLSEAQSDMTVTLHPISSLDFNPRIAAIAEVNMILNQYDLSSDFVKEVLNNYFKKPKLVNVNDIFCIDLTPSITAKHHYKYLDLIDSTGKLYFKCSKISDFPQEEHSDTRTLDSPMSAAQMDVAYFIVKGVTQLTLGESIHSLKPKFKYFNMQNDGQISCLNCPTLLEACPVGLKQVLNQLQEIVSPFVRSNQSDLIHTSLPVPILPALLLTGALGSGRHLLLKTLAKCNGMNYLTIDCNALQSSTAKQTESKINSMVQKAKASSPVIVVMDNFEVFAVDAEDNEDCRLIEYFLNALTLLFQNYSKCPIIFVAVTERSELKPNILRIFLERINIPKPNSKQRYEMLEWFASVMQLNVIGDDKTDTELENSDGNENKAEFDGETDKPISEVLKKLAAKTETFLYGDLDTLVHFAVRESFMNQQSKKLAYDFASDPDIHLVKEGDFNTALESMRALQSQHLDAPKIPKVHWEDIGGLDKLKKELLKTIEFPIKYPHLFKNSSLKRSGILLYGPPGCGKTLVAKAVSTELNVSFLSVKGPELLNMYIGQSEENVRKVFESARASSPCIVFLDELDALAPRRGAAGDSGGASDRVVSQLLAEVDGVGDGSSDTDSSSFVFIMGATNRPDLLEQSLLRPGRLDKMIYVGPYCGLEEKTKVLSALCRSHKLGSDVKLEEIAGALPDRCTGADLLQVVSTARSAAVRHTVHKLHAGEMKATELDGASLVLGTTEMEEGVRSFRCSVTDDELAYYESLQGQM